MLAQSNDNFVRATASNQTLANVRTMVAQVQRNMAENAQAIRDEVAEHARQIDRNVSTQLGSLAEQVSSNLTLVGQVQEGISRAAAANQAQVTVATTNITALQANTGGKMISYQQCEVGIKRPPVRHACDGDGVPRLSTACAAGADLAVISRSA